MDATNNIATDLFFKVRSRFSNLKLGDDSGQITINPEMARFFDFDYVEEDKKIGHVSISLAEPNSMKVYFSNGITEGMDRDQKDGWYGFLRELRKFSKRRLLAFDTRDIAKDNLDKRDYAFLSQYANPASDNDTITKPVGESVMNESNLYGTKTQSFQKLENTKLIIKHSKKLADDMELKPGARSRNISALFVQNESGERFKYPFVHLAGARAMQRHVANGGAPYDSIGESLIKMSEEIAQLKTFTGYVVRNDLMNSDTNRIVERSKVQLDTLRERIAKLSKQSYYEAFKESFEARADVEVDDTQMEQYKDMFTVKNFKEDLTDVFPVIHRLMKEEETVGYDDIVGMTAEADDNVEVSDEMNGMISDLVEKFSKFRGGNGDRLPDGYIQWALNSGITTDFVEENEAEAMKEKYGEEEFENDPLGHVDEMPITKAFMDEIEKITGDDDIDTNARIIDKVQSGDADESASTDEMAKFEAWVDALGEESPIQIADQEEKADMIRSLSELTSQEFTAGVDGTNAITSLEGIIDDPKLEQDIKAKATEDTTADVRPLVKAWIEENAPDLLGELDFGDMAEEPAAEEPAAEGITDKFMKDPSMGMNKYGLAAIQKDGMFFSIKDKKITGGPFDSIDELKKHQEELMNKDSDDDYKDTQPELKGGGSAFKGFKGKDPEADELNDIMKLSGESYSKTQEAGDPYRQSSLHIGQTNDPIMFKGKEIDLDKLDYDMQDISDGIYELNAPVYYTDGTEVDDSDMAELEELPELNDYIYQDYMDRQAPQEGAVSEGGNAWDMALTGGMEIISNCDDQEECIKQLEAEITGGKDADDAYADMITKDFIEKIKKHGLEKVKRDVDAEDIMGEPVDLEGQETEGNEYGDKVSTLKAQGAKKGTKFKTSDGEEHTLEGLAEFIKSFYDESTNTFPKGPEGVATMVGKKFGEQAEQVARKMVERMAPAQEQGAEELEELGRIKDLIKF